MQRHADKLASQLRLSIVIPIYNEEQTLPELVRRTVAVIDSMPGLNEIILVNDGSVDGSLQLLQTYALSDERIRFIDLSRNFGHQAALLAGMSRSQGEMVVLMDGDLQDPPEIIPELVKRMAEGYDVVFAVRMHRKEGLIKRVAYSLYYRLLRTVASVPIPLNSGDFSLMTRRVVDIICELPERQKFIRGLRAWSGFKQSAFEYSRSARFAGTAKYTYWKLFKLGIDGLLAYSVIPLRIAYVLGFVISSGAFLLGAFYVVQRLSGRAVPQGFTTLAVLILFLGGVQLVFIGIVGEYLGRVYEELKGRPMFVEREAVNFARPDRSQAGQSDPTL